ncbi:sugar ABC transporter [Pseudenterobacter timonensis]|uniref:Sugar ABC transporter n=1 Tax=Pseudenterobacter timonensis TaxID=1755099 RepID=A0AAE4DPE7_9ENTR|nr:sugar ABC transporter [Pseudenterobacter timonensis]MDR9891602.1 sugar ABC transporter [Pseudenterobacter timonensis]
MWYTVECSYNDSESEAEWNAFYNHQKLPALISVTGFTTSQRFRAVTSGCPVYLAIHTVKDANTLSSDDYFLKGGGNFARWQSCITDWHRNLYEAEELAPDISSDEILLLSSKPIDFLDTEMGYRGLEMLAVGLDKTPDYRVAYVLPSEIASRFTDVPGVDLYEPLTSQLQSALKEKPYPAEHIFARN